MQANYLLYIGYLFYVVDKLYGKSILIHDIESKVLIFLCRQLRSEILL